MIDEKPTKNTDLAWPPTDVRDLPIKAKAPATPFGFNTPRNSLPSCSWLAATRPTWRRCTQSDFEEEEQTV